MNSIQKRGYWKGTPMILAYILAVGLFYGIVVDSAWFGIGIAAVTMLYWMPWLIAYARHTPNVAQVAVLNFFAFLFCITWIVAMCMAFANRRPEPRYVRYPA